MCSLAPVFLLVPSRRLLFPSHVTAHTWWCLSRHLISCKVPSWAQPGKNQYFLLLLWQESLNSSGFHRLFSYISAPSWPAEAMLAAPHTAESTSSPKPPYSCWKAKALALGGGPGASCVRQQPRIMYIWAKFFAAALGWIQSQVKLLLLFPGETEADFALWVKLFQMIWQIHFVLPSV